MKKLAILLGLVLFSPAFAADDEPLSDYCIQVMTPAVSPLGVCQVFSTPCDIPSNWKTISSCDLIKPKSFGQSLSDVIDRRSKMRAETLRKKAQIQAPRRKGKQSGNLRLGKTEFIKEESDDSRSEVDEKNRTSFFSIRAVSKLPNYDNKQSYARYKARVANKGALKQGPTRVEKYQSRIAETGRRRTPIMGSTEMDREGYLSGESFWNQRPVKNDPGEVRYWREFQSQKRVKVKHEITNRRGWKGERLDGTLD